MRNHLTLLELTCHLERGPCFRSGRGILAQYAWQGAILRRRKATPMTIDTVLQQPVLGPGLVYVRSRKPFGTHSYEKCAGNSFGIHSYKIIGLKLPWNQLLQKKRGGGPRPCLLKTFSATIAPKPGGSPSLAPSFTAGALALTLPPANAMLDGAKLCRGDWKADNAPSLFRS